MALKFLKVFLFLLFLTSAILQINDPDPLPWVLMYGLVALVAILSFFNIHYRLLELLAMAFCVFELINSWQGVSLWMKEGFPDITGHMEDARPYIEEAREFFGTLFCLAAIVFFYVHHRRQELKGT